MNSQSYELMYGTGGHGGPHIGIENAQAAAQRYLDGCKSEHTVYIVPRTCSYEWKNAVEIIKRDQPCETCGK